MRRPGSNLGGARPGSGQRTGEIHDSRSLELTSFEEIGRALGITRAGAWMHYRNAIRKLRQRYPRELEQLRQLAAFKHAQRPPQVEP